MAKATKLVGGIYGNSTQISSIWFVMASSSCSHWLLRSVQVSIAFPVTPQDLSHKCQTKSGGGGGRYDPLVWSSVIFPLRTVFFIFWFDHLMQMKREWYYMKKMKSYSEVRIVQKSRVLSCWCSGQLWVRVKVSHPLVITARQVCYTTLQWCHAPPVPEDTSPAVLKSGRGQDTATFTHTASCSQACEHSRTHTCTQACTHTVTFIQKHTQTHPLHHTQTHQQCVQESRTCCLQAPLFSGKDLAFHKHPSVCLCKLPGCANSTLALVSESTLCQSAGPSNSAQVVDKTG